MKIGECRLSTYLSSHLMARDRDEEQIRLIWIMRHESTIPEILEKVSFARVFSGQLPRRLIIGLRIPIGVHVHLKSLHHLLIAQPKHLRQMIHIVFLRVVALLSPSLYSHTSPRITAVINILE